MAQGRFSFLGSRVFETSQVQRGSDGARGKQFNEEAGNGGKGGKLRLSRTSLFKKKPYDRPLPSGTLDRLSSSGGQNPSLPARIVDSASNLVTSSASYLFHSFFKHRQTRWIDNGIQATAGRASTDEQHSKDLKPSTDKSDKHPVESSFQEAGGERVGGDDTGFVEVEEFLKRQTLSRDEVMRLTEVLHRQGDGGSEASGRHNIVKHVREESNPVQLAKAYMGRRTTPQWQNTPSHYNEVAGPSSRKSLQESMHEKTSVEASRARVTPGASVRMLKRRLIGDEEDDVIVTGPARRVRQKMTITANSSPYIRQVTSAVGRTRTPSVAAVQPSEKMEKSPEPLEEPLLPSKGKLVEEPVTISGPSYIEDVPESSKARDSVLESDREASVLPVSSFKPTEPVVITIPPTAVEKPVSGPLAASIPELPVILPDKTGKMKGFRISAFFEDSSSDEEADAPAKASTSMEAQLPRPLLSKEAQDAALIKQPFMTTPDTLLFKEAQDVAMIKQQPSMITPDTLPSSFAVDSAKIPVPVLPRPIDAAEPPNTKSDSPPVVSSPAVSFEPPFTFLTTDKLTFSLPSAKPFPALSQVPAMTDKGGESSIVPQSTRAMLLAASSASLNSSSLPVSTPPPSVSAVEASLWVPEAEAATAAVMPSPPAETAPLKETPKRKAERSERGAPEASGLFSLQPATVSTEIVTPNIPAPAAAPKFPPASEASAAGSPLPLFAATPPATPVVNQAGMSDAQPVNATAADSPLEARRSPMFESPSAENRQSDMDTMATDPMTEEPDGSTMGPSAPTSLFGSTSSAVSTPVAAFGSGSGSASSPFSFSMQSSTPSQVSQSPFSGQSSSAASQPFTFGSSGPSPANPFSASSQSAFSFGSSAATSMSSMFPATSSAPSTFPATSPAPSPFLFGAQASSSALTNSTSGFGGQTTPSANAFTGAGAQNNAPAFPFQAPPGTSTPPAFQFGGASAGSSSLSSTPSFGGQASFAFGGGQPANVVANPFAQNSGSNASPFQFGAAAATASQPVFSSGAAPASNTNFAFGAQVASSPFPFNFGSQHTTVPPTGQPFAFGGQPAAPAPSPFIVPGSTGQGPPGASGMEFAGGFSLGAAGGGEKSGRKFIKAKRIGGSKRGK